MDYATFDRYFGGLDMGFNDEPDAGAAGQKAAADWGPPPEPHPDELVIVCDRCLDPLPCGCPRPTARTHGELVAEIARLRDGLIRTEHDVQHALGGFLHGFGPDGLPQWGDHTAASLAAEAVKELGRLRLRVEGLADRLNRAAVALGRMEAWCRKGLSNGEELAMLAAVLGEIGPTLAEIRGV